MLQATQKLALSNNTRQFKSIFSTMIRHPSIIHSFRMQSPFVLRQILRHICRDKDCINLVLSVIEKPENWQPPFVLPIGSRNFLQFSTDWTPLHHAIYQNNNDNFPLIKELIRLGYNPFSSRGREVSAHDFAGASIQRTPYRAYIDRLLPNLNLPSPIDFHQWSKEHHSTFPEEIRFMVRTRQYFLGRRGPNFYTTGTRDNDRFGLSRNYVPLDIWNKIFSYLIGRPRGDLTIHPPIAGHA